MEKCRKQNNKLMLIMIDILPVLFLLFPIYAFLTFWSISEPVRCHVIVGGGH